MRGWGRFVHSDLWAEDGLVFLREALSDGLGSLWMTRDGSYHTLQRLMMLGGVRFFPLSWLPSVVCATYLLIFAAIVSRVASRDYEWLIPSLGARVFTACMLCMAPGLTEMMGNLCNLNWILFIWLALVGLKNPKVSISGWELAFTSLVTVSIGTSILLVPLFVWRLGIGIRQKSPRDHQIRGILHLTLILLFGVGWLIIFRADRPSQGLDRSFFDIFTAFYDHIVRHLVFQPWIGDRLTSLFLGNQPPGTAALLAIAFLVFLVYWARHYYRRLWCQAISILAGGVSCWSVLCILARPAAPSFFLAPATRFAFQHRYSFPLGAVAILFWMTVLRPTKLFSQWKPTLAMVFIILNLSFAWYRFFIPPYGSTRLWQSVTVKLDRSLKTGCPRRVAVLLYPENFKFEYVALLKNESCTE